MWFEAQKPREMIVILLVFHGSIFTVTWSSVWCSQARIVRTKKSKGKEKNRRRMEREEGWGKVFYNIASHKILVIVI